MCNIFSYQGNSDENHNDIYSFKPTRMAEIKKIDDNKYGQRLCT